jgi:hypothetical protein
MQNRSPRKIRKKITLIIGGLMATLLISAGIKIITDKINSGNKSAVQSTSQSRTLEINREFTFPVKTADNQEITKIKFAVQKANIGNEIVIKGQKATAVPGRTFLTIDLKITNDYNQSIQINTRDYVRLQVDDKNELLAPDIHNDPVEVQAISTKYTRVGFPVNISDDTFVLQIGEIKGDKQKVDLNFK